MCVSTRKVRAIDAATGILSSCQRASSASGQRLCSGVWQAGDVIWQQAVVSFFYYILRMRRTKKDTGEGGLGVTLHGLRDGFLQKKFERLTGQPAPMMGVDVKYV